MVRLDGVGLDYGAGRSKTTVLHDLTFEIEEGGFRWLLGPSGAGKTSLLRLLNLTTLPTQGQLTLLGQEIAALRRAAAADPPPHRYGLPGVPPAAHLSAFDNVALPLRIAGRPEGQIRVDVVELLSWVGLSASRLPPRRTLRRRAAARRHRPRRRRPAAAPSRRRAHRQPRRGPGRAPHAVPARDEPARHDRRRRHPQRRDGQPPPRAHAPPPRRGRLIDGRDRCGPCSVRPASTTSA